MRGRILDGVDRQMPVSSVNGCGNPMISEDFVLIAATARVRSHPCVSGKANRQDEETECE